MRSYLTDLRALERMSQNPQYSKFAKQVVELQVSVATGLVTHLQDHSKNFYYPLPADWSTNPTLTINEQKYAREPGGKIPAIKAVRERLGLGLKDAKDYVEAWMQKYLGFTHHPAQN